MTVRYVRSGAGGSADGTSWANAFLTLATAFAAGAAGDTFYVSEDHAETQASALTLACPSSHVSPSKVLCADHAGSVPPVSADLRTTGSITTTGNNGLAVTSVANGSVYWYGLVFNGGSGANAASLTLGGTNTQCFNTFEACALNNPVTNGSSIGLSGSSNKVVCFNCSCSVGTGSSTLRINGYVDWYGSTLFGTGSVPGKLVDASGGGFEFHLHGADISTIATNLIDDSTGTSNYNILLENVKTKNTLAAKATVPTSPGHKARDFVRTHDSVNYSFDRIHYAGSESVETTIIRTGGASDGTQGFSKKIVTNANCKPLINFSAIPIYVWNDTTGASKTLTVEGVWTGGALPNNDDVWIEVEYLGDSASPKSSFVSSGLADVLATHAANASSSVTWGGGTTKFKMSVTFTPQKKGPVIVRVKVGAASATVYICPKVAIA